MLTQNTPRLISGCGLISLRPKLISTKLCIQGCQAKHEQAETIICDSVSANQTADSCLSTSFYVQVNLFQLCSTPERDSEKSTMTAPLQIGLVMPTNSTVFVDKISTVSQYPWCACPTPPRICPQGCSLPRHGTTQHLGGFGTYPAEER